MDFTIFEDMYQMLWAFLYKVLAAFGVELPQA